MRRLSLPVAGTLVVPLLIALVAAPAADASHDDARLLVGYAPGDERVAHAAIALAGGSVQRHSPELGFAVVTTDDPETFRTLVLASGAVEYVETDDATALDGAQWNGAQWNGAQWNGAQWNGAQWNGAQWNGAQWNGAQWNGAQWNAAHWTITAFDAEGGSRWIYDETTTDPGLVWQWGLWRTGTVGAWPHTTGSRTASLCVLDSGVAGAHPDVAPNLWTGASGETGYNAIDPAASWEDDAGHGTHIAGVAAAAVGNAWGVAGVGNVRIMPVKVLNETGQGHESDLAFGLAWCATRGADVAVMALSATERGPTMDRALAFAHAADVLLLASAGNDGACSDCVAFPADDPRVVAVSAIDGNLTLAAFSSVGPEVELAAPGVHVLGPFPGDAFVFGSGTSQAVAMAAGAAALVRDARPDLSGEDVRALLWATARDLGEAGRDDAFGHGLVRVDAALAAALGEPS